MLMLLVPTFITFIKFFGSAERALLAVWALVFICSGTVTRDDPLRSFISVGFGLALATIGQQPNIGTFRFTLGLIELWDGLKVVLLIMGVFAIPQLIEMSRMRGMGNFLVRQGVWIDNPLKWMQGPRVTAYHRMPKRIGAADMKALWLAAAAAGHTLYRKHLGITMLSLLYGTGLRRGELQRLKLQDWNRDDGTLRIDGQKTGQERCVPVPRIVYHCIESYLPQRHNHLEVCRRLDQQALLVNRDGNPLDAQAVSQQVHRIAKRAGIRLHSLHQFRHSCASDLLAAGASLPEVQRILGHSTVATTMRYLHIADPERHAAMKRHPLNDWLTAEAA